MYFTRVSPAHQEAADNFIDHYFKTPSGHRCRFWPRLSEYKLVARGDVSSPELASILLEATIHLWHQTKADGNASPAWCRLRYTQQIDFVVPKKPDSVKPGLPVGVIVHDQSDAQVLEASSGSTAANRPKFAAICKPTFKAAGSAVRVVLAAAIRTDDAGNPVEVKFGEFEVAFKP